MTLTEGAIQRLQWSGIEPHKHIVELEDETIWEVNNQGDVRQLFKKVKGLANGPLRLHTLTGLLDYIKSNLERTESKLYLHILNNKEVILKGLLEDDGSREQLVVAEAHTPDFGFDYFYDSESFLIALNSKFVNEFDRKDLIAFAGNVKEDNARQTSDDGFSQKTTVKRGISQAGEEIVPNPVVLAPYRTFTEIAQPESEFVFRMKDGPRFALFEADGGAWKNHAIFNIKAFLEYELEKEIDGKRITILA